MDLFLKFIDVRTNDEEIDKWMQIVAPFDLSFLQRLREKVCVKN